VGRGSNNRRHYGLATYIWLRSLILLVRCALKRDPDTTHPAIQKLLLPFASQHSDAGLMMASATVILSCFILKPEALQGAYASFLNKHGGKSVAHYRAVQSICLAPTATEVRQRCAMAAHRLYAADPAARQPLLAAAAAPIADLGALRAKLYRMILFPGKSTWRHYVEFVGGSLSRSLAVNLPIYAVPALLVHRRRLLGPRGPRLAMRAAAGAARSSLFLSTYCATAWLGPDIVGRVTGDMRAWTIVAGVPAAGLAVLIEKPSRRQELGVYCASRAVEAAALSAVDWGWVPAAVQGWRHDVALFSLAAAAIMHCYNAERDVFKSKYLNVLDFVFGNQGHGRQRISHEESYYQVLMAAGPAPLTPLTPLPLVWPARYWEEHVRVIGCHLAHDVRVRRKLVDDAAPPRHLVDPARRSCSRHRRGPSLARQRGASTSSSRRPISSDERRRRRVGAVAAGGGEAGLWPPYME